MKHDSSNSAPPPRRQRQEFSFTIRSDHKIRAEQVKNSPSQSPSVDVPPVTVRPFPVDVFDPQMPALPKLKRPSLSSHRHEANPALAMNLLQDIQQMVEQWQSELRQIVLAIQNLYMEGPLVDGWLESHTPDSSRGGASQIDQGMDTAVLRHGDPEQLMTYVKDICQSPPLDSPVSEAHRTPTHPPEPQYRFCSLDKEGRLNCQPCPPDQLVVLSMAIARYRKLRQFLNQKQYLEARLKHAVDTLTIARNDLRTGNAEDT
ncbi:MAG: hypothetical protein QNJ46_10360 [Leptolyngbyaceae cyanobacterium MO_188.B28]|nr:hypothetical protein [Leptolyngbyaceae cyanobacterium MO_188.B28]